MTRHVKTSSDADDAEPIAKQEAEKARRDVDAKN